MLVKTNEHIWIDHVCFGGFWFSIQICSYNENAQRTTRSRILLCGLLGFRLHFSKKNSKNPLHKAGQRTTNNKMLLAQSANIQPSRIVLNQAAPMVLGRLKDCAEITNIYVDEKICLKLSRKHVKIEYVNNKWMIVDMGASNKIYVNQVPVEAMAELKHNDFIRLSAEIKFSFVDKSRRDSEKTTEVSTKDSSFASSSGESSLMRTPKRLLFVETETEEDRKKIHKTTKEKEVLDQLMLQLLCPSCSKLMKHCCGKCVFVKIEKKKNINLPK